MPDKPLSSSTALLRNCARCGSMFECNAADITNCHCYAVKISPESAASIAKAYADCLCGNCLREIIQKEKHPNGQPEL